MPSVPKAKHDHRCLDFPEGFLWGTATSAFQVEGNNINSDWWEWEQKAKPIGMRSGKAADQYHLYEKDFDLAKSLNNNAHRLSIEWSRIEPTEGEFNQEEIEHYKKVLKSLKDRDIKIMLTLWHFSNPAWFAKKGGWTNLKAPYYFERFVKKIVPEIEEYVDFWITLNEPGIYTFMGYLGGDEVGPWPPAKNSKLQAMLVTWNLARAHKTAYKALKQLSKKPVGIAQNVQSFGTFHKHSFLEQLTAMFSDITANHSFYFLTKGYHDFLGLNYYFNRRFNVKEGSFIPKMVEVSGDNKVKDVSDLGWEVYPEGMFDVLTDLSDGLPIYITECGIASTNDDRRTRFLINYLQEVYRAIQAGVKVKGFFYWSLIDNLELHRGFDPRFGLIEVDYKTQKRTPRPSSEVYAEIAKHNAVPHEILKLLGHGFDVSREMSKIKKAGLTCQI